MSSSTIHPTITATRRQEALRETLKLLSTEWTREHLLGFTPLNDAAILSSPLQQLHSISFEATTQFDRTDSDNDCNALTSSESVVIPAYSKDGWSAGFVIEESYGFHPQGVIICPTGETAMRFLANEVDGTFIGVIQHSTGDIVWHFRFIQRSGSCTCLAFPPNTLNSFVRRDGVLSLATLEKMLHSTILIESIRSCSVCAGNRNVTCSCVMQLRPSKNPLDLATVMNNVYQVMLGKCAGTGYYESFENGELKKIIAIDSHRSSLCLSKHGAAKKLLKWAIGDVLKTVPSSIHRAVTSPLEHFQAFNCNGRHPDFKNCQDPLPTQSALNNGTTYRSELSPESVFLDDDFSFPDILVPPAEPMKNRGIAYSDIEASANEPFWPFDSPSASAGRMDYASNPGPPSNIAEEVQAPLRNSSIESVAAHEIRIAPKPMVNIAPAPLPTQTPGPNMIGSAALIPPNRTARNLSNQQNVIGLSAETVKKTEEDLRAWKAYQRKIRNRESAARSNLARKQRRLELARRKKQSTCN